MNKDNNYIELHSPALLKALQRRKEYFQALTEDKKEEAYKFQEFIDNELKKAGNQNNRMSIIQQMMKEQLRELHKQSSLLSGSLKNLSNNLCTLVPEEPKN